jgi:PTS system nitrogen regulatory IIA component
MPLNDLLSAHAVLPALKSKNKKQVLQELAARAADSCGGHEREIFETLLHRERLGSTGIGQGVAIPHGKLASLGQLVGLFARLEKPIDFEALDGEPVDLIFLLLAPEGAGADHLKALARIARLLRDEKTAAQLRTARDETALRSLLTAPAAAA